MGWEGGGHLPTCAEGTPLGVIEQTRPCSQLDLLFEQENLNCRKKAVHKDSQIYYNSKNENRVQRSDKTGIFSMAVAFNIYVIAETETTTGEEQTWDTKGKEGWWG